VAKLKFASHIISNVPLFRAGVHQGSGPGANREFTTADLDNMVLSFTALGLQGKVPLKLGHNDDQPMTDGQPSLGWVNNVRRQGDTLYGDFTDVPDALLAAIKAALYKHVSIELLTNVKDAGTTYPYVLDGVALLGADIPAVSNLADLQKLAASRERPALSFSTRVSFSSVSDAPLTAEQRQARADEARRLQANPELEAARAEIAQLKAERDAANGELTTFKRANIADAQKEYQRGLLADLEAAVRAGKILPATREKLIKMKRLAEPEQAMKFSRDELSLYLKSQDMSELLKGLSGGVVAFARDPKSPAIHGQTAQYEQGEVLKRIFARAEKDGVDVFDALNLELQHDPDLGQAILAATFE
jgi:hypothetical protein